MDNAAFIAELERLWDLNTGFFGKLRQGVFEEDDVDHIVKLLGNPPDSGDVFDKRLVSLIWYIPMYMEWQIDRVRQAGGDLAKYERAKNRIQAEIEHYLGVP